MTLYCPFVWYRSFSPVWHTGMIEQNAIPDLFTTTVACRANLSSFPQILREQAATSMENQLDDFRDCGKLAFLSRYLCQPFGRSSFIIPMPSSDG